VDIREWFNNSVGEDWTDKGLEWIEPSPLTLAKEPKVDLEPFHDLPIGENLTTARYTGASDWYYWKHGRMMQEKQE
jgi:hypothetical protein